MKSTSNLVSFEMSSDSNITRSVHDIDDTVDERDQVTRIQAFVLHLPTPTEFILTFARVLARLLGSPIEIKTIGFHFVYTTFEQKLYKLN